MSVPTNLIPTKITGLPEYTGTSQAGYFPYVLEGTTYKVQFSSVASSGEVPPSRTITAGTGLVGGGDLSANRIFAIANGGVGANQLDTTGVVAGVYGNASNIPTVTVDANGRVTSVTTSPVVATGYVPESRTITAGTGLIGGGSLAGNITLSLNISSATPQALGNATAGVSTAAARGDHVHPAVNLGDTNQTQGALPLGRGGTGDALSPVAGAVVYSTGTKLAMTNPGTAGQVLVSGGADEPEWRTIAGLGTVTSVNASGGSTGMTFTGGPITTSGTLTLGGTLATGSGGTGLTGTPTNGQLLIGNGTGYALSTLTAGTAVSITNAAGSITIDNTAPDQIVSLTGAGTTSISGTYPNFTITSNDQFTGTVTSVAASGGTTGLTFSGSPITTAGTLTLGGTLAVANGGTGATTASGARTNLGAAASGANSDITSLSGITGGISTPTFIAFDTTGGVAPSLGQLRWDSNDGTLDLGLNGGATLKVGQQTLFYAKNTSGGTIPIGTPVMFTGVVGASGKLTFGLAVANGSVPPEYMMGVTTQNVVNNAFGYITSFGLVRGFNTSGAPYGETWADGDLLYFSPATPGGWTKVEPQAPNIHVPVAVVVNAATGGSGSIFVRMIQSERLGELQDVEINGGGPAAGQVLIYDASQSRWENNTLTAGSNVTITNGNGSITIAATEQFTGTVTSVAASGGTTGLTFSGSPITSAGTLTLGGTLAIGSGGTGATTAGGARTALGAAASGANTDITSIALTSGTILNAPTSGTDIVNKAYADSIAAGINFHQSVRLATVAPLPANTYNNGTGGVGATLTANANGALSIDGVAVVAGNRVLVKDEVAQANNGVYVVTQTGSGSTPYILTRATDFNTAGSGVNQIDAGDFFLVTAGNTLANTSWVQQTPLPITVGTTPIIFSQFGAPVLYSAGTGLSLAGTVFSIANTGVSASTYGSASQVPVLAVNAQGQITSASNTSISIAASQVTSGSLAVARGGTGLGTTPTNGQLLIGNGTGYSLSTLSAGTGISVSNGSGSVTVTNTAPDQIVTITGGGATVVTGTYPNFTVSTTTGTGTVTSVDVSGGSTGLSFTGGPITSSGIITMGGTLGVANGGTGTATAFTAGSVVFAGASGVYSQDNANLFWDDANNRLGIGTTSPAERLAVAGNVQATQGTYCFTGVTSGTVQGQLAANEGGAAVQLRAVSNHPLAFFTNNTERARITAAGDVGIGTTSPARQVTINSSFPILQFTNPTTGNGANDGLLIFQSGLNSTFSNQEAGAVILETANTERVRIDSSGNVGIGTTSPFNRLAIVGQNEFSLGITARTASTQTSLLNHPVALLENSSSAAGNGLGLRYQIADTGGTLRNAGGVGMVATAKDASSVTADMYFYTGISERMRITSAGDVGIGTSSPGAKLHVVGNTFVQSGTIFTDAITSYGGTSLALNGGSNLISITGGTERMRIDSAGSVGIGTNSPSTILDVAMTGNMVRAGGASGNNLIQVYTGGGSAGLGMWAGGQTRFYSTGNMTFSVNSTLTTSIPTGYTDAMTLDTATAGRSTLTLNNSSQSLLSMAIGGSRRGYLLQSSTEMSLFNEANGALLFGTNATERMRITAAGNVGINTTTPATALDVNGQTTLRNSVNLAAGAFFAANGEGLWMNGFASYGSGITSDAVGTAIRLWTSGTERVRIDSSGNVGIGTSTPGLYPYGGLLNVAGGISMALGNRLGWGITDSFTLNGVTTAHYGFTYGGGSNFVTASGYYGINFATLGADRMRITSSGNVTIGNSAVDTAALSIARNTSTATVAASSSIVLSNRNTGINGTIAGGIFMDTFRDVADPHYSGGIWFTRNPLVSNLTSSSDIVFGSSGFNTSGALPAEIMRLTAVGNLGIGTTAPSARLHAVVSSSGNTLPGNAIGIFESNANNVIAISAPAANAAGVFFPRSTVAYYAGIERSDTNLVFKNNDAERMRIDSAGNMLLGTTVNNFGSRMEITATGLTNLLSLYNTTVGGGAKIRFLDGSSNAGVGNVGGNLIFYAEGADTERARINISGNFGIGTSSPNARLAVQAAVGSFFTSLINASETEFALRAFNHGSTVGPVTFTHGLYYADTENTAIKFYRGGSSVGGFMAFTTDNGTERMRIDSSGNVGIGTNAPGTRLDVIGNATFGRGGGTFQGISLTNGDNSASAETVSFIDARNNLGTADGHMFFVHQTDGGSFISWATTAPGARNTDRRAERMRITPTGNVGIGTTNPTERLDTGSGNTRTQALVISGDQHLFYGASSTEFGFRVGTGGPFYGIGTTGSNNMRINSSSGGDMLFAIGSTERARINSSGQFLVGTTSGGRTVCINAADNWIRQSNPSRSWLIGPSNDADYKIYDETAGSTRFRIDTAGNWFGNNAIILGSGANNDNRIEVGQGRTGNNFAYVDLIGDTTYTDYGLRLLRGNGGPNATSELNHRGTGPFSINVQDAGVLVFSTSNTERFRITSTGAITSSDLADAVGYKGIPQNAQTASYTLALSDIGKHISITTGGVTIPANGSVAFPIGSAVTIYNNSASNQTISITSDTLRLAGTATTGSRTLAQRGICTCVKVAATEWVISGAGLT